MFKLTRQQGVFSDILRVIDWFWYSKYTNCPVYIDWKENDINLFEYFFQQKYTYDLNYNLVTNFVERENNISFLDGIKNRRNSISFYKKYKGDHPKSNGGYFYCTHEVYKELEFNILRKELNTVFNEYLELKSSFFTDNKNNLITNNKYSNKKILGVHLRWPGHYYIDKPYGIKIEANISSNDFYKINADYIKEYFIKNSYDYIYLATDSKLYSDILNEILPEKIIQLPYKRVKENIDTSITYTQSKNHSQITEINNILLDVYNLSKCKHFISAPGNITFGVLIFNPNLTFNLYPLLENAYSG
jgi:hypothetical protein